MVNADDSCQGQSQRLQIARAYLKDAEILIFDEATANLDADSEYAIISSLYSVLKEKTVVIIAHRLSTVKDVDCIFFLEEGKSLAQELIRNYWKIMSVMLVLCRSK